MTFINRSVVISRAVTILRSNETYLCIGCLPLATSETRGGAYVLCHPHGCTSTTGCAVGPASNLRMQIVCPGAGLHLLWWQVSAWLLGHRPGEVVFSPPKGLIDLHIQTIAELRIFTVFHFHSLWRKKVESLLSFEFKKAVGSCCIDLLQCETLRTANPEENLKNCRVPLFDLTIFYFHTFWSNKTGVEKLFK
jgi:hypothetical protein